MAGSLFILFLGALFIFLLAMKIYGTYISFKKAWYIGLASIVFPGFAEVVGLFKFFTKKDVLK